MPDNSLSWLGPDISSEDAHVIQQLFKEGGYLLPPEAPAEHSNSIGDENRMSLDDFPSSSKRLSVADQEAIRRIYQENEEETGISLEDQEAIRRARQEDAEEDEKLAMVFAGMPDRPVPGAFPSESSFLGNYSTGDSFGGTSPGVVGANRELSPVDPQWETLDPTPDIRALFIEFDRAYFWGSLSSVEVKWSPQMFSCAGICRYHGRGSGYCSIGLSRPLLQFRPRKDLVETLLHEMIHAYLFVASNDRDRESHGENFHAHMHRINKQIGSSISVYHSFHDEVNHFKRHVWRCDGPCRNQRPYFGYVKRAMNRAPSKNDLWWETHTKNCGGQYTKIQEPEGFKSRKRKADGKDGAEKPAGPLQPTSAKGQATLEKWGFSPVANRGPKTSERSSGIAVVCQPTVPTLLFSLTSSGLPTRQPSVLSNQPFTDAGNAPGHPVKTPVVQSEPASSPPFLNCRPGALVKDAPEVIVLDD